MVTAALKTEKCPVADGSPLRIPIAAIHAPKISPHAPQEGQTRGRKGAERRDTIFDTVAHPFNFIARQINQRNSYIIFFFFTTFCLGMV